MLVKINNQFINVYKWNYKWQFKLTGCTTPDLCYLAINDCLQYIYVAENGEEYTFNFPQTKIKREIKKLQSS